MAMIKGITVVLVDKIQTGVDPFGAPTYEDIDVPVENVLVSPVASSEVLDTTNLTGKKTSYTLAIPKGDTHEWKDRKVKFFGATFRTIGEPVEGIEDLIPLGWNKKVTVERYE